MKKSIFLIVILVGFGAPLGSAFGQAPAPDHHKDDIVVLDNGDRLTGEIVSLERGMLYFKSKRAIGTLQLDWARVVHLQSKGRYEFETVRGVRRIGRIMADPEVRTPNRMSITLDDGQVFNLSMADVIGIREMRHSLLGRVDLSLEAGITYTQGNDQFQVNTQVSFVYDHPRYSLRLNENSLISGQSEGERTSRHEFQALGTRYLSNHWNYLVLLSLLNDAQQDLNLRSTFGGGLQRFFVKNNRTLLGGIIGAVYTNERYQSDLDSNRSNAEILTGLNFSTYKFRSSEVSAYLLVFPSLSDWGRIRVDSNAYIKWEIVSDLYWKISFFNNFDSSPPPGLIENNFGFTSSLGWSF